MNASNNRSDKLGARFFELLFGAFVRLSAWSTILVSVLIVYILFGESLGFFSEVSVSSFLFGSQWTPLFEPKSFGVLPILMGTMMIAVVAGVIAIPLGLAVAIYFSEYASKRFQRVAKPVLEVLAGIPSVVYGFIAIAYISPLIRYVFPEASPFNALSGGIVVAVMILPMIASLSEDALSSLPKSLREAAYATGATRFEVVVGVLLPAAASGVVSSFILGISRAIGETMAVTLAAGATPKMGIDYLDSIQTMTAYIVQVSLGDVAQGTIQYQTLFAVALVLFGFKPYSCLH
jgi:phosphate transport system permease protein